MKVRLIKPLRYELKRTVLTIPAFARCLKYLYGRLRKFLHCHKPLRLGHGLYSTATAVMRSYIMGMILNLNKKSEGFKVRNHLLPCLVSLHSLIFSTLFIDGGIIVHYVYYFKIMALTNLEVIGVVRRSDLNDAGTEFLIHVGICYNGDILVHEGQDHCFACYFRISLIIGIYRKCRIAQHSLGTRRCYNHIIIGIR